MPLEVDLSDCVSSACVPWRLLGFLEWEALQELRGMKGGKVGGSILPPLLPCWAVVAGLCPRGDQISSQTGYSRQVYSPGSRQHFSRWCARHWTIDSGDGELWFIAFANFLGVKYSHRGWFQVTHVKSCVAQKRCWQLVLASQCKLVPAFLCLP